MKDSPPDQGSSSSTMAVGRASGVTSAAITTARRNSLIVAAAIHASRGANHHNAITSHAHDETIISTQSEQFHASTSESLAHCSSAILVHYNRLATVIGWRAVIDQRSSKHCLPFLVATVNYLYLTMVILMLLSGYVLQYATCFRQDSLDAYDPLPPQEGFTNLYSETLLTTLKSMMENSTENESHYTKLPTFTEQHQQNKTKVQNSHTQNPEHHRQTSHQPNHQHISKPAPEALTQTGEQLVNATRSLGQKALDKIGEGLRALRDKITSRQSNISYHNSGDLRHHHEMLLQCRGGTGTYYVIPALIHFAAYLAMLYLMRSPEEDRFHNLVVVTYLLMTKTVGRDKASTRLKRIVRGWLLFGALALVLTTITHVLHLYVLSPDSDDERQQLCFTFLQPSEDRLEVALTVACLLAFSLLDFICIAIYITYALHCELNVHFLNTNVTAMREKRINFREFTKNTEDAKTNLDYLNSRHSIGVSILLVHFVSRILVVVIECLFGATSPSSSTGSESIPRATQHSLLSGLAVAFWLLLLLMVLIQAARVTFACKAIRHIGHELRSRPFCYQTAPYSDLDSLLNYTSTLHMSARLLLVPVRASCVATIILLVVVIFLVLGQVNVIQF